MFKIRFNNMNNKEIEYLIDENGNYIKCGFEGKCNNYATRYFVSFLKDGPLCEEHWKYFDDNIVIYETDKTGVGHVVPLD